MDIGYGNWQPQGEWNCVCKSHFDKRGRRPGSSQPVCSLSLFLPIQNWSVFPFKQLSCLCFFWCCEVHQYSSELGRERETNFQQKQLNDALATRSDPLPFAISYPGHTSPTHVLTVLLAGGGLPRIQMWCPHYSYQLPMRGKSKQACKVMGRCFKGCAVVSSLLAKESCCSAPPTF